MVAQTPELIQIVTVANTLGEGVLWNDRTQTVWWTDIEEACIYEYDPVTGGLRSWDTPYRVGCFGFTEDSDRLAVAFEQGIAVYDLQTGAIDWLVEPGVLAPGLRFNDGKIDSRGRFWVGSMVEDPSVATARGALYCLDPAAGLEERVPDIVCSNGLCWSPDDAVMYHADSPDCAIRACCFDADTGRVSEQRVFARTPPGIEPDGSTVDALGGVWSAQWGGSRVVRYDPDGREGLVLDVPARQPSCVAFGGADMKLLFVTSATTGISEESAGASDGHVFIYRTEFTGLVSPRYQPTLVNP